MGSSAVVGWLELERVSWLCTSHNSGICHLSAKNYQNWSKFDKVPTKKNVVQFFNDTVYRWFSFAKSVSRAFAYIKRNTCFLLEALI